MIIRDVYVFRATSYAFHVNFCDDDYLVCVSVLNDYYDDMVYDDDDDDDGDYYYYLKSIYLVYYFL